MESLKIKEQELCLEKVMRKKYSPPVMDVIIIEMECGIAANSAATGPQEVNGNTSEVSTGWDKSEDTTIDTGF